MYAIRSYYAYNLDPLPGLASSYVTSKDGLQWTFTLREGAFFSDGTPITAAAFRDSWLNLLDPATAAPYASLLDFVAGAEAYRTGSGDLAGVGIRAKDESYNFV